jgi:peptidoglycan-N-acetylglucosamine deacetylase
VTHRTRKIALVIPLLAALTAAACAPVGRAQFVRPLTPMAPAQTPRSPLALPGRNPLARSQRPLDIRGLLGDVITHGPRTGGMVAITMDDGPSKESSAVLDIVERTRTPVTFFYCGRRILAAPTEIQRAVGLGCEIGDHTTSHIELVGLPSLQVRKEVVETRDIIRRLTGVTPVWVRPRSGKSDALARSVIRDIGMAIVLWNDYPSDTIPSPSPHEIAQLTLAHAHAGSIILLHETNPKTVEALPEIIAGLRARGLTPVTLSTMLRGRANAAVGSVGRSR